MARSADSRTTSTSDSAPKTTSLDAYARLLVNRVDLCLRWTVAAGRPHWYCSREKLTRQALDGALHGTSALGLYAVGKTGLSRWLVFDGDDDAAFHGIGAMALALADTHTILLERSRRGGHAWILCPPTPWQQVAEYGHHLQQAYGLRHVEQYPSSGALRGVKAPLTRHPRDRKVHPLIDPGTGEVIADPLGYLATLTPTPLPEIETPTVRYRADPFSNVAAQGYVGPPDDELLREASHYTTLTYKGNGRWVGRCPFHRPDNNPSFGILNGSYWRCWANCCGEGRSHGGINSFKARLREKGLLKD